MPSPFTRLLLQSISLFSALPSPYQDRLAGLKKRSRLARLGEGQSIEKEFLSGSVHRTLPGGTYLFYRFDESVGESSDESSNESFGESFGESIDESFDESFGESFGESYKFLI